MEWAASLGARGLQPKTIKSYISAVRSLHLDADLPFDACESPVLQRLLRGIKRFHGERDRLAKLPITLDIMRRLSSIPSPTFDDVVFLTAVRLAFAGFLRCGEFTTSRAGQFDPNVHLSRSSIKFVPSVGNATHIVLTLPASKTDPFRKGVSIYISSAPGAHTCPVTALSHLFTSHPLPPSSPLFVMSDGNPLTRSVFIAKLKTALLAAGIQPTGYSGHSFRRGAATAAASSGFLDHEIQQLGRWRSDAYKLYIDTSRERILNLSYRLHWADSQAHPFEPPSLPFAPTMA
ncbi:hypothetical protein ONZ45_g16464 [Pleurotus djamor]|nr:hypothetical protein ONZ45_g16464 [Pleurotus djamor]